MSAARVDSCARCARPNHRAYIPDPHPSIYQPGDIWAAREHVSSAIHRLFKASLLAAHSIYASRRAFGSAITWGSARSRRSIGLGPKSRPCLILQVTAQDVIICLLASFDGESRLSALPKVLQYICIPIHPHPLARHPNTHCHTTPEWPEEGMWLIASPFRLQGRVEGRWQDRRPQGSRNGSFQLSPAETEAIIRACEQKQSHWEALCGTHEKAAKNYLEEYEAPANANVEGTPSPAASVTSRSKNSPRLGALRKKIFSGSKSTLNLPE
ncbi:hypothetical protein TRAPUB_12469 [Trametes pubescens]|uniref:Uncharacterized protein n=1 Tax=Trametes pubescens TaxID=154538 RepID=A0A1M2VTT9_TRAPU|nr:hypothetical protein TRAPUB_12469 [Trametes pubescens]